MGKLSTAARTELVNALARRYVVGTRAGKTRILDEFEAVTGFHRKHAMRILRSGPTGGGAVVRGGRRIYDDAVREALVVPDNAHGASSFDIRILPWSGRPRSRRPPRGGRCSRSAAQVRAGLALVVNDRPPARGPRHGAGLAGHRAGRVQRVHAGRGHRVHRPGGVAARWPRRSPQGTDAPTAFRPPIRLAAAPSEPTNP